MTEVENVALQAPCVVQHLYSGLQGHAGGRKADSRVEVALEGDPGACPLGGRRGDTPVHSDDVRTGRRR